LLEALNDSTGNILDDDNVMLSLETLKHEANEITNKIDQTDLILEEVNEVTSEFAPLAENCSALFFVMQKMSSIQTFYQFSLDYFFLLIDKVLEQNSTNRSSMQLEKSIFAYVYSRTYASFKYEDAMVFGLLLSEITDKQVSPAERDLFISAINAKHGIKGDAEVSGILGRELAEKVMQLSTLAPFKDLPDCIKSEPSKWSTLIHAPMPEVVLSELIQQNESCKSF
jgi:dynein heavy chain 1, cytosolic